MLSLLSQSYWDKYYIEANKIITFLFIIYAVLGMESRTLTTLRVLLLN